MMRWPLAEVRITHIPTGLVVRADFCLSLWKMRKACLHMLRGKLWSLERADPTDDTLIVRSYTEEDFNRLDIVDMPKMNVP